MNCRDALGSYVIVSPFEESSGGMKAHGEIAAVLQPEQIKSWKKRGIWSVRMSLP